ncbi:uncharacterized protein BCR38DRAFT_436693 [Pseudomassariella vexata]|uniref:C6 transcription factor n=1 Tax=Pseudomassariella vexata TaxID=1141098 RepID=A0A1Y2DVR1_9PEZI|nr:uncharacterized protein BCR38DRAFT_436693 [Pseudomassariella vexata]ORY63380.1 hypothetical protein BCR38DRAFT_436693 [Pseudomassariella vexata]
MVTTRSSKNLVPGTTSASPTPKFWHHAPDRTTLFWMCVSLPLVIWDCGYVLGRPYTMEGGFLHRPLYTPYKLYGEVDHVYGWKSWEAHDGFPGAQGSLNVVETAMYLAYVWIYFSRGQKREGVSAVGEKRVLTGKPAAWAALLAFSAAVMTLSKTVLYWANEYFSGFNNIGHNTWQDLISMWIIPNMAWLVFPTYMIYVIGGEIIEGLTAASSSTAGGNNVKSE